MLASGSDPRVSGRLLGVEVAGPVGALLTPQPEAVAGNEAVTEVEAPAQERHVVEPAERRQRRLEAERVGDRLGAAPDAAVGLDELQRRLTGLGSEAGVALDHARIAKRLEPNAPRHPTPEPRRLATAEAAAPVVDEDRPRIVHRSAHDERPARPRGAVRGRHRL